jgi:hypothetical protein
MPTSAYTKYTSGAEALAESINAGTAAWKVALVNTVNLADTSFTPGTTDLATGGGYTQGGEAAATSSSTNVAGVYKLVLADPATWTGSAGGFGPFRYAILYDSTTNIPVGHWDYGSSISVGTGETFTVELSAADGVFTIT